MTNYYKTLQKEMDAASGSRYASKERPQLVAMIEEMNVALKGPLSNGERIGLCADRKYAQMALAALDAPAA